MRYRSVLGSLLAAAMLAIPTASADAADTVYWTSYASGTIGAANLDGSGEGFDLPIAGVAVGNPSGIALDPAAGRVYWADYPGDRILGADLDGSDGFELNTKGATVFGPVGVTIDVAAGLLYWANYGGDLISAAKLDGSGGFDLATEGATVSEPGGMVVDPLTGRVYWANIFGGLWRANADDSGGGEEIDRTGASTSSPFGVAVDRAAGRVYWSTWQGGTISGANLDSSGGGFDLATGAAPIEQPRGIALDAEAGKVYWADTEADAIGVAALDGSGGGSLDTTGGTVTAPEAVALLRSPRSTTAPTVQGTAGADGYPRLTCVGAGWADDMPEAGLYRAPRTIAYRWSRDGTEVGGATEFSYTPASPGSYACEAIATNAAGMTAQGSEPLAVAAPPIDPPAGEAASTPTSAPSLFFSAKRRQPLAKLKAAVSCDPASCRASLSGVVVLPRRKGKPLRLALRTASVSLGAGQRRTVKLRLRGKGMRRVKRLAARGALRRARARVILRVRVAESGQRSSRSVKLILPRK